MSITVVIPTIPPRVRDGKLERAMKSIARQDLLPEDVIIAVDLERAGAAANRDRGLDKVRTEWTAFLDDDDELYRQHLRVLHAAAVEQHADLVYPWFDVGSGGTDPFPHHEGQPFDPANPCQVPVTFLARTSFLRFVGGFSGGWKPEQASLDPEGNRAGEDWHLLLKLIRAAATIHHHPERTWRWHHHGANTSGLPSRWR